MFKIDIETITFVFVWLAVISILVFYIFFRSLFTSITQLIISLVPAIVFLAGTVLFYNRDHRVVKKAKENNDYIVHKELNWGIALKHDFLTFFIPFLIVILPFLFGEKPDLITVAQAILVYLTLTYLKFSYWGEL